MNESAHWSERVMFIRARLKMSCREVGERCGVHVTTVSRWSSGRMTPHGYAAVTGLENLWARARSESQQF